DDRAHQEKEHPREAALAPTRFMDRDPANLRGAGAGRLWRLHDHPAPFFKAERTNSSTGACAPDAAWAARAASSASGCLKPSAISANTVSLSRRSLPLRARCALDASHMPAA